jgi:hypothetical protein
MPTAAKPPFWFWIAATLFALWGLMGVGACIQQLRLGAEAMGPATEYDRALYASLPGWYNIVYAVATGAGFVASLAMLLRRRIAVPLFALSLLAVLVQFGWLFAATDIVAAKGAGTVLPFPLFIAAVAVVQLWVGWRAEARGWIG